MTRGRKPKPTKLKLVQGNQGKRPINKEEPTPSSAKKAPTAPTYLKENARKEWKRIAGELVKIGTLTVVDYPVLEAYCTSYADMIDAQRTIDEEGRYYESETKDGSIIKRKHPAVADLNESIKLLRSLGSELGLTPASRSRVTPAKQDEEDPMEAFLRSGKKKE